MVKTIESYLSTMNEDEPFYAESRGMTVRNNTFKD